MLLLHSSLSLIFFSSAEKKTQLFSALIPDQKKKKIYLQLSVSEHIVPSIFSGCFHRLCMKTITLPVLKAQHI